MKRTHFISILIFLLSLMISPAVHSAEQQSDTDRLLEELQEQFELSKEKLAGLKPMIDEKSKQLKQYMDKSVDKGFIHYEEMKAQLGEYSKKAQKGAKDILSSEEVESLKEQMSKMDSDAVNAAWDKIVADLKEVLSLSEEQVKKVKPIMMESASQISQAFTKLTEEGAKGWQEFKNQYEKYSQSLSDKLKDILDPEQTDKLDDYLKEKEEVIKKTVVEV